MNKTNMVEERAQLLARVVLIRREDVAPLPFQTGDLDLLEPCNFSLEVCH